MNEARALIAVEIFGRTLEVFVVGGDIHAGMEALRKSIEEMCPEAVSWHIELGQGFKLMPQYEWNAVELWLEIEKRLKLERHKDRYVLR